MGPILPVATIVEVNGWPTGPARRFMSSVHRRFRLVFGALYLGCRQAVRDPGYRGLTVVRRAAVSLPTR
jgi:hypothetical protein